MRTSWLLLPALLLPACVADDDVAAVDEGEPPPVDVDIESMGKLYQRNPSTRGLMPGDYDGDHAADLAFKRENGIWAFDYSRNGFGSIDGVVRGRGGVDSLPAPADYNGDTRTDVAVYYDVNGEWGIEHSVLDSAMVPVWDFYDDVGSGQDGTSFGTPVPTDYDGDEVDDRAILWANGMWMIDYASNGFGDWDQPVILPGADDGYPVPADYPYFADLANPAMHGKADIAIKDRAGDWKIDYAENGFGAWDATFPSRGGDTAVPAPGDYDGDGLIDLSVRADDGRWLIDYAANGYVGWELILYGYGGRTASPVPADYDGDGVTDLSVQESCGTWFIDYAADGFGAWNEFVYHTNAQLSQRTVFTADELLATLRSEFVGTIRLPANITYDFTNISLRGMLPWDHPDAVELPIVISSCVRLEGMGGPLDARPLIFTSNENQAAPTLPNGQRPGYQLFALAGDGAHFENIHLRGPEAGRRQGLPFITGLAVRAYPGRADRDIRITRNEMSEWPGAAIAVSGRSTDNAYARLSAADAEEIVVSHNYIHENAHDGQGYGVLVDGGGYARIERNVFTRNRHAVSAPGTSYTGYIANENYVLEGGYKDHGYYNQHFDVHGVGDGGYGGGGGEYFEVTRNTIRGEQDYFVIRTRPSFMVRGTPSAGAFFADNVDVHDDCGEAIKLKDADGFWDGDWNPTHESVYNVHCTGNRFDVDYSTDIGVGDFDGDGLADVFHGTGITWWYSSGGVKEWRYLNTTVERASQLKFARVDGDNKTDVIIVAGPVIYYSSGGTTPWIPWTATFVDTPQSQLHFADFTGDNRADIFRTKNGQWWLWSSELQAWTPTLYAGTAFEDMRFGEFDTTPGTDLLARLSDNAWHLSSGSTVGWTRWDATARVSSLRTTVVGDFDGNGRSDLAWRSGNTWQYVRNGRGAPLTLRTIAPMASCEKISADGTTPTTGTNCPSYAELSSSLIGNFDGFGGVEALAMERRMVWYKVGSFAYWSEQPAMHFAYWNGWSNGFVRRSGIEMR